MKSKYLHRAVALTLALTSALSVAGALRSFAQPPERPVMPPMAEPPRALPVEPDAAREDARDDERNPLITWNRAAATPVREILQAMDEICPQKIILGQGVSNQAKVSLRLANPTRLFSFLDTVCSSSNLHWGFIDRDTIVVLRARPAARPNLRLIPNIGPLFNARPRMQPLPQVPDLGQNPLLPNPAPNAQPNPNILQNARPHNFNGQQFYVIPLQPAHAD